MVMSCFYKSKILFNLTKFKNITRDESDLDIITNIFH